MASDQPRADILAELTLSVKSGEPAGLLVSLTTNGDFADEAIDRRFFSVATTPPDDLPPHFFWASILEGVARFLGRE